MIDDEWKYWEEMDKQKRIILPWMAAPIPAMAALA